MTYKDIILFACNGLMSIIMCLIIVYAGKIFNSRIPKYRTRDEVKQLYNCGFVSYIVALLIIYYVIECLAKDRVLLHFQILSCAYIIFHMRLVNQFFSDKGETYDLDNNSSVDKG